MLYCMITPQMKASDVCHMQPSLPQILSCLLIHLPFPSHSPQLPLARIFMPTKLEAACAAATPGMRILPIARCQTCHGTPLSKCTTRVSPLRVLLFFFQMKLGRRYCLWNIYFFWAWAGKTPGRGNGSCRACWCTQHPDASWQTAWFLRELEFFMFYTIPQYNVQLHFLYEEYHFQMAILPKI